MTSSVTPHSVLVIEDDPLLSVTLRRHVERLIGSGNVMTAECIAEASRKWDPLKIELALVDYRLPDGHGTDLIKQMRASGCQTRVICMTAESEAIPPALQTSLGIERVFTKPVEPESLALIMPATPAQPVVASFKKRRIGRYRHIRYRQTITGPRLKRMINAAANEKWIAFEVSKPAFGNTRLMNGICAWAGWLSANGGQLCFLTASADEAEMATHATNGLIDSVCSKAVLQAKASHLTSQAERTQLMNILHRANDEATQ